METDKVFLALGFASFLTSAMVVSSLILFVLFLINYNILVHLKSVQNHRRQEMGLPPVPRSWIYEYILNYDDTENYRWAHHFPQRYPQRGYPFAGARVTPWMRQHYRPNYNEETPALRRFGEVFYNDIMNDLGNAGPAPNHSFEIHNGDPRHEHAAGRQDLLEEHMPEWADPGNTQVSILNGSVAVPPESTSRLSSSEPSVQSGTSSSDSVVSEKSALERELENHPETHADEKPQDQDVNVRTDPPDRNGLSLRHCVNFEENEQDAKNEEPEDVCCICRERPKSHMFVPCGHKAVCHGCAAELSKRRLARCPICREEIKSCHRIFSA
jgi:hypothetical protein